MKLAVFVGLIFLAVVVAGNVFEPKTLNGENGVVLDKCWFLSAEDMNKVDRRIIDERQRREDLGYPSEIPIADALHIFNEEQRCLSSFEKDLTEDEVLSALSVSFDYGNLENWKHQKDIVRRIITTRTFPKGSLLVNEGGGIYQSPIEGSRGQIKVKGQRVYLFMNLSETSRYSPMNSEQIFLIKKTFYGVEQFER